MKKSPGVVYIPQFFPNIQMNNLSKEINKKFSFDTPLSGPNQNYTKTVTSEEKYGKKFKAIFRIEIFDN